MTAIQNRRDSMGRHPLLKQNSLSHRVFMHLKQYPELTLTELASGIHEEYQVVNGCVQRMKKHGLVYMVPKQHGDRVVYGYCANLENETGHARDVVEIETTVFVNDYGEYSVKAVLVSQLVSATGDNAKPIVTHVFKLAVPKPKETRMRDMFSDNYIPGSRKDGPIIDLQAISESAVEDKTT